MSQVRSGQSIDFYSDAYRNVFGRINGIVIEADARIIGMDKQSLVEEFNIRYSNALDQIGFSTRDILPMSSHSLAAQKAGTARTATAST